MTRDRRAADPALHARPLARFDSTRVAAAHHKAVALMRTVLRMTAEAGSGHPSSASSLSHLVVALLYGGMRWDPERPDHPAADRLVLSEGHACPIVYAAAADLGVALEDDGRRRPMTRRDALSLRELDSPIDGHPHPEEGFPFFPAATGSLGQGLSLACGLALAARLDGLSRRIFCLIGDGESREGQVWEALDFLVDHDLRAVCPIFNANGQGQTGTVSPQQSSIALAGKLEAFGLEPLVCDGHDPAALEGALHRHAERAADTDEPPLALVARTVKGWGMPSVSSQTAGRHGKPVQGEALERALEELDRTAAALGARASDVPWRLPPPPDERRPAGRSSSGPPANLDAALDGHDERDRMDGTRLATREAYGIALRALGEAHGDVVALDGDVSNSTHAEIFARTEGLGARFFEGRIAEQNLVSVAAGLAAGGKRPFASSFGQFLQRTYDQVEMAVVGGLPLRLVGSHVGLGPAADGPSQMALTDAAWFASVASLRRDGRPVMHVLTPSDPVSAYALTLRMAEHDGASYLRTMRQAVPALYALDDSDFRLGGHRRLRRGGDLALAAWGAMVHVALAAAETLAADGIEATVADLYSLPLDDRAVADLVDAGGGRVLTVEDNADGALGSAVAGVLAERGRPAVLRRMRVGRVPKSARRPEELALALGLGEADVVAAARELLEDGLPRPPDDDG